VCRAVTGARDIQQRFGWVFAMQKVIVGHPSEAEFTPPTASSEVLQGRPVPGAAFHGKVPRFAF
jgi:hypothetical protein